MVNRLRLSGTMAHFRHVHLATLLLSVSTRRRLAKFAADDFALSLRTYGCRQVFSF